MNTIEPSSLKEDFLKKPPNGIPLILIAPSPRTMRKFSGAGYQELLLNRELSSVLLEYPADKRPSLAAQKARELIEKKGSYVMIQDFEMLFDPRYHLNVLRFFADIARSTRIAVLWCGTMTGNNLVFAEPGYADYQTYNTNNYALYCVK